MIKEDGCLKFSYSEMECYDNCPMLYFYRYVLEKERAGGVKLALEFGKALHKGVELFFTGTEQEEAIETVVSEYAQIETMEDDKRTSGKLRLLLECYFEHYKYNNFLPIEDGVETAFELPITDDGSLLYRGRLDMVGKYRGMDGLWVKDVKTSFNPATFIINPNTQFTGYQWACKELYGECSGSVVDLVGVYKNKPMKGKRGDWLKGAAPQDVFMRYNQEYNQTVVDDWKVQTEWRIKQILECLNRGVWYMKTSFCSAYFSKCEFLDVCQLPPQDRGIMLNSSAYRERSYD